MWRDWGNEADVSTGNDANPCSGSDILRGHMFVSWVEDLSPSSVLGPIGLLLRLLLIVEINFGIVLSLGVSSLVDDLLL